MSYNEKIEKAAAALRRADWMNYDADFAAQVVLEAAGVDKLIERIAELKKVSQQAVNTIIQVEMEERGMKRADMARELGVSPVTVTKALNNPHRDWRITTLDAWANAMNCDLHIEFRARQDESEPR